MNFKFWTKSFWSKVKPTEQTPPKIEDQSACCHEIFLYTNDGQLRKCKNCGDIWLMVWMDFNYGSEDFIQKFTDGSTAHYTDSIWDAEGSYKMKKGCTWRPVMFYDFNKK